MQEFFGYILWIGIIYYFIKKRKNSNKEIYNNDIYNKYLDNKKVDENLIQNFDNKYYINNKKYEDKYYKNEYLLTKNEIKFYRILKLISIRMDYYLFCQVALYQIVRPKNSRNYADFNKIKSKSIDFVLADENCRPILCIELDDNTHERNDRIERDNFINELFKELGIKLLRVDVKKYYDNEDIDKLVKESL